MDRLTILFFGWSNTILLALHGIQGGVDFPRIRRWAGLSVLVLGMSWDWMLCLQISAL